MFSHAVILKMIFFFFFEKLNYQIGGRIIVFSKKAENIFLKIKKIEMLID